MQSLVRKISSLLGITSTGQATMANSLPVVIASNQSVLTVATAPGYYEVLIRAESSIGTPPLLISPTAKRVTIKIQNAASEDAFVGTDDTIGLSGWKLQPGESLSLQDTDSYLWVKAATSGPSVVIIEEVAS